MKSQGTSHIFDHCMRLLELRNQELRSAIDTVQNSANSETKSTAGDKHETARAMAQLDVEMLSKQLAEVDKSIDALKRLRHPSDTDLIQQGSVVTTSIGVFYLSVGIGNIEYSGTKIMAISLDAPLAKVLLGKKAGDQVSWNGNSLLVASVSN